jgi:hypothetical protein
MEWKLEYTDKSEVLVCYSCGVQISDPAIHKPAPKPIPRTTPKTAPADKNQATLDIQSSKPTSLAPPAIIEVKILDPPITGKKCAKCGAAKPLEFEVTFSDKSTKPVCAECAGDFQ